MINIHGVTPDAFHYYNSQFHKCTGQYKLRERERERERETATKLTDRPLTNMTLKTMEEWNHIILIRVHKYAQHTKPVVTFFNESRTFMYNNY